MAWALSWSTFGFRPGRGPAVVNYENSPKIGQKAANEPGKIAKNNPNPRPGEAFFMDEIDTRLRLCEAGALLNAHMALRSAPDFRSGRRSPSRFFRALAKDVQPVESWRGILR